MEKHATEYGRLAELTREQERVSAELGAALVRWADLAELVEAIERAKAKEQRWTVDGALPLTVLCLAGNLGVAAISLRLVLHIHQPAALRRLDDRIADRRGPVSI
jgi:hypothetical protein